MRRCWAASSSHVVQLWNAAQALVATSVASTETSGYSGWVEVDFPTPIAVTAEEDWTGSVESRGPCLLVCGGSGGCGPRVTSSTGRYIAAGGFPINTNSADYFVDLHYEEAGVTRPRRAPSYRSTITFMFTKDRP